MNKKRAWEIIDFEEQKSSTGRRGHKVSYRKKYAGELKTWFNKNIVRFNPAQPMLWLK